MGTLGEVGELINASQVRLHMGTTPDVWRYLQVLNVDLGAPEFKEPTTDGKAQWFYGDDESSVDFEMLVTSPEIKTLIAKRQLTNGLASSTTWEIVYTDTSGGETTLTVLGTLSPNLSFTKPEEGGVKATGRLRLTANVTSASVG